VGAPCLPYPCSSTSSASRSTPFATERRATRSVRAAPQRLKQQSIGRAGALELALDLRDSQLEIVDQLHARVDVTAPRLGDVELAEQLPPGSPNRSDIGTWWPNAISVEWIRFFRIERSLTRCRRNRERSRSWCSPDPRGAAAMARRGVRRRRPCRDLPHGITLESKSASASRKRLRPSTR